ncbi:hypothetical protein [Sulfurihydrogenibium sp.]|uniref:hypothetical protein n=1 Tax=Sulfurihydrogenibium sp. TaxID=2053621 RepID=UPI00260DE724|nr:hypothetical protein [Sulfurihydrogenibium sp.]
MAYTLPRDVFNLLEETFGSKEKAEKFVTAVEKTINEIYEKAKEVITQKKEHIKIELKEELKNELITRDLFEERFKIIDERFKVADEKFKRLEFKLNILIVLVVIALTFANPNFVALIEKLIKP